MLEARSLSCRRNARKVFRDVAFRLAPGGALQVTGANGSGKSSLLRVLAGLLPAASGEVAWDGRAICADAAHLERVRYIGHLDAVKPALTGGEMQDYWRALGCGGETEDAFGVAAFRHRPVRTLSAGQKRRLSLSRLSFAAPLWLLDEPTAALDDAGQALLSRHIALQRARGGMAVIATHQALNLPGGDVLAMAEPA